MNLFLQENCQEFPFFALAATIYETALKVENDPVHPLTPRFALTAILLAMALLPTHTGFALQSQVSTPQSKAIPAPENRIDINTASVDQLLKVPGMTHTWAARIVRFRPYRAKNELLDRGIVTSAVYDRIKDYIVAHRPAQ